MKTIPYWSFSPIADRTILEIANKIWGFYAESGRKVGRELGRVLLPSIEQSASEIAASYQCAKERYDTKQQEFQQAEQQAFLAYQSGNTAAGNLAMGKAIAIRVNASKLT